MASAGVLTRLCWCACAAVWRHPGDRHQDPAPAAPFCLCGVCGSQVRWPFSKRSLKAPCYPASAQDGVLRRFCRIQHSMDDSTHNSTQTAYVRPLRCCCFPPCRAAEDAAAARDGYDFYGSTLRVELARGGNPRGPPRGPTSRRPNASQYRVLIRGLPPSASWQDLKVCAHVCATRPVYAYSNKL